MTEPAIQTEGQLIKAAMGDNWHGLTADIRKRFEEDPTPDEPKEYTGTMSEVSCTRAGRVLALMTGFLGGPLIPHSQNDVPIEVRVYKKPGNPAIYKKRTYSFTGKKPYTVESWMVLSEIGEFQEFCAFGLGLRMTLDEVDGNLVFNGHGYFLKLGRVEIPIPLFLSPGRATIVHSDHGENAFRVRIEMHHPLFGRMFVQDGVFEPRQAEPPSQRCKTAHAKLKLSARTPRALW